MIAIALGTNSTDGLGLVLRTDADFDERLPSTEPTLRSLFVA